MNLRQPTLPRKLLIIPILLLGAMALFACSNGDDAPPTEVRVITSTPSPEQPVGDQPTADSNLAATIEALAVAQTNLQATINAQETRIAMRDTAAAAETNTPAGQTTPQPTTIVTATTPTPTSLPSIFPTPRLEQIIVVEQVFENGRMFWFRDRRETWVVVGDEVDPTRGEWLCFEDTFQEGDVESLPTFEPPADVTTDSEFPNPEIQQPIRGFGKVWRENDDLRAQLGWALTSEIEHSAPREYVAGGFVNDDDEYEAGPGEYRIHSFYGQVFTFLEDELDMSCPSGRWRSRPAN